MSYHGNSAFHSQTSAPNSPAPAYNSIGPNPLAQPQSPSHTGNSYPPHPQHQHSYSYSQPQGTPQALYPDVQYQQAQYQSPPIPHQYPPVPTPQTPMEISSPQPTYHSQPMMDNKQAMQAQQQPTPNHPQPPHPKGGVQHGKWTHGMCDCFEDFGKCCLTCWCPCITYGRIQHRLRNRDMQGYSCCNGPCVGFCALASCCGFQWIMSMMQRGEVRHQYGLPGSGCGDCCRHFWCECCALIQEDRETEIRKSLLVPANQTGYQAPQGMNYPQKH